MTILCALGYRAAGMDWFDAIAHSFSTVAIGGFSTHDASLGHFDSPAVEGVAMVFMVLAGINFALHFVAWRARSPAAYFQDAELKAYVYFLAAMVAGASAYLYGTGTFEGALDSLRAGAFQAIAFATTTGFTTSGYTAWPGMLPVVLLLSSFVGACAGSTGGGLKVIRVPASRQAGAARDPSAHSPQRAGLHQGRRDRALGSGDGRGLGVLRRLRGRLRVPPDRLDGHRARPGHRVLRGRRLPQQPRAGDLAPWGPTTPTSAPPRSCS